MAPVHGCILIAICKEPAKACWSWVHASTQQQHISVQVIQELPGAPVHSTQTCTLARQL